MRLQPRQSPMLAVEVLISKTTSCGKRVSSKCFKVPNQTRLTLRLSTSRALEWQLVLQATTDSYSCLILLASTLPLCSKIRIPSKENRKTSLKWWAIFHRQWVEAKTHQVNSSLRPNLVVTYQVRVRQLDHQWRDCTPKTISSLTWVRCRRASRPSCNSSKC